MFRDTTILVTGAGGSIGSALCRKLAAMQPKMLILFELNEYALYKVDQDLTCNRLAVLGDVKDKGRLDEFMEGVDYVFHCAAYKHVPMCEAHNANEAHKNNYIGTINVLESAKKARAVVLLSTDKAINPIGVMGETKMMAERAARRYGRTVARLGNILESSGSVIPKFREQIAAGGPVTVTHPEATRYFIEMDKAVEFISEVAMKTPDVYMINLGQPRKILEIAKEMIGDRDIAIEFTGLRSGEKLHEDIAE
jgi:FlaA1/EpsC-like NDP-sugar epimerase